MTLIAFVLVNCSRALRLNAVINLPGTALDDTRLHVSGMKSCPPASLSSADPSRSKSDAESQRVTAIAGGFSVEATFHGGHCLLKLSAWYDTNGNRIVDAGDYSGETLPVLGVDRDLCQGNSVEAPALTLTLVP